MDAQLFAEYVSLVTIIHLAQKSFGKHRVIVNIHLWLCAASHDWGNSMPIWLHCNYVIHSVHKEISYFIKTVYELVTYNLCSCIEGNIGRYGELP